MQTHPITRPLRIAAAAAIAFGLGAGAAAWAGGSKAAVDSPPAAESDAKECPWAKKQAERMRNCPLALEGTRVEYAEVSGGAAMIFSTDGDVAELQRRVEAAAERHQARAERRAEREAARETRGNEERSEYKRGDRSQKAGKGKGYHGKHGYHRGLDRLPAAKVQVEATDNGARLVLTAKDNGDTENLRAGVKQRVERMAKDGCPYAKQAGKICPHCEGEGCPHCEGKHGDKTGKRGKNAEQCEGKDRADKAGRKTGE